MPFSVKATKTCVKLSVLPTSGRLFFEPTKDHTIYYTSELSFIQLPNGIWPVYKTFGDGKNLLKLYPAIAYNAPIAETKTTGPLKLRPKIDYRTIAWAEMPKNPKTCFVIDLNKAEKVEFYRLLGLPIESVGYSTYNPKAERFESLSSGEKAYRIELPLCYAHELQSPTNVFFQLATGHTLCWVTSQFADCCKWIKNAEDFPVIRVNNDNYHHLKMEVGIGF